MDLERQREQERRAERKKGIDSMNDSRGLSKFGGSD
jgi:hypothetical protein